MDEDFALWGSVLETDLIENDKIDQLKEIGGIRSQNLLSLCSLFIFYLLQWSRAKVCWVTDSLHMGFTIITIGHCVPRIRNNSRGLITYGNSTIVHIPIQTEMLENKKNLFSCLSERGILLWFVDRFLQIVFSLKQMCFLKNIIMILVCSMQILLLNLKSEVFVLLYIKHVQFRRMPNSEFCSFQQGKLMHYKNNFTFKMQRELFFQDDVFHTDC